MAESLPGRISQKHHAPFPRDIDAPVSSRNGAMHSASALYGCTSQPLMSGNYPWQFLALFFQPHSGSA
jgi:hypothetical protein